MCTHSSREDSRLPTALLLVTLALQPAKGAGLPYVGPQDWEAQYVAGTTHSPGRVSAPIILLLFWVSSQWTGPDLIASLPFPPNSMCIFFIALAGQESFCQSPVSFQWELIVPHVDVFLICLWRRWVPHPPKPPSWSPPLKWLILLKAYVALTFHVPQPHTTHNI